ncbi:MAG: tetratricopeptide repeat protein [Deltaproteobacteria bacterium]|nr:tetratricopeptide repeat protein [Deltaproteobacteria bacterium]
MADRVMVAGLIDVPQTEIALLLESGYLYLEMQKHKEAEEIFAGVAALVPHSEVPLICLGNLHFSQGRYDRALKFHKDALVRNPKSALAQAHTGEALLFMQKRPEAKKALEKALELEPDGAAAEFAKAMLDGMAAGVV